VLHLDYCLKTRGERSKCSPGVLAKQHTRFRGKWRGMGDVEGGEKNKLPRHNPLLHFHPVMDTMTTVAMATATTTGRGSRLPGTTPELSWSEQRAKTRGPIIAHPSPNRHRGYWCGHGQNFYPLFCASPPLVPPPPFLPLRPPPSIHPQSFLCCTSVLSQSKQ
jgi:hypothetical protein